MSNTTNYEQIINEHEADVSRLRRIFRFIFSALLLLTFYGVFTGLILAYLY